MPPPTPPPADDFTLLHASTRSLPDRSRWTVLWMMGLAVLIVAAVVALVWYLNRFESEEEERRRGADAQWLEQSVQFHFRRLEDDVAQQARQAALDGPLAWSGRTRPGDADSDLPAGLLQRAEGVVLAQAWLTEQGPGGGDVAAWYEDVARHEDNRQALQTLQDIVRGLRRASYAGPMRTAEGEATDRVWLAVPYFDGTRLVGMYAVQLAMRQAVDALLPPWFLQKQTVRLVVDGAPAAPATELAPPYRTVMNLPGTDLLLEVVPQGARTSPVPRIFFLVALLFLLGMLAALAALRRDFGKRQQVQQRLQAEVALRTAMEGSVTIGMRAWDMGGRILYVNDAFCAMLGYSSEELRGTRAPLPYWPPEQAERLAALHQSVIRQGTQPEGIEVQFRHKSGHLVDVLIHEAPLTTADGTQLGWMSSILDISERKRAQQLAASQQEKLEASARLVAVGEVASTLAHELNQPLGALSSFASGLLNRLERGTITESELQAVVRRMAALAERAGGVTQRVNAFARRRELNLKRLDLVPLVRRAAAATQETHGAALQLQLQGEPAWVRGDALLLEHLVHNLCGNALDWARRAGQTPQVQVRLQPCPGAPGYLCLAVADNGPGVPEEAQARIFDAFFSTKEGGMGMGLAICRSIAEAHHGRILVGRDALLGGALFTAELPLAAASAPSSFSA
ncbi:PAS domain-containing sensor histidine kinase [Pulveribacter suum]|uniref:histidine kinase n=1 Tax=Pulveribacter suum TaxID=2116657 RepID=A0A2P1NNA5_9BURK|nr:PAS domain-containing sensor histidine kinase [Pulveribacter suum]AVP58486.1 hypothetical protein C7H73_12985 [Pulveribacter suum]